MLANYCTFSYNKTKTWNSLVVNKGMEIKEASKYSISNMLELEKSKKADCYHCMCTFEPSDISETTDNGVRRQCVPNE
jgi:hypothetical protein